MASDPLQAPASPVRAWIGLGTNLTSGSGSDLHEQLDAAEAALAALAQPGASLRVSPRYVSAALPVPERPHERQPDYLNAVASLRTSLAPLALLDALQAIENAAGRLRVPGQRWAARPLDLDLLLYADRRIDAERLCVPHPAIAARAFVLQPLADLDAELEVPGAGAVSRLLARVPLRDALARAPA